LFELRDRLHDKYDEYGDDFRYTIEAGYYTDDIFIDLVAGYYTDDIFIDLVVNDAAFSFFSVAFVLSYTWFHTGSISLAFLSMGLILFSFPLTAMITEGIFRVTYFSSMHTMSIFIVLGVAADDIFVFIDAWR